MTHIHRLLLPLVAVLAFVPAAWSADEAAGQLTAALLQDETAALPAENTAFFNAAGDVNIRLDLLAAAQAVPSDALVTVVRPDGSTSQLRPDASGTVTVPNAQPGPHAVVASSSRAHGTTLFYFQDQPDAAAAAQPARLTMLDITGEQLVPLARRALSGSTGQSLGDIRSSVPIGQSYGYRVALGENGLLRGRVLSVMSDSAGVSLADTQITIFYQGSVIGSTTSDADGYFELTGLRAGQHGLVASGAAGFAAMAFETVTTGELAQQNAQGEQFVAAVDVATMLPVVLVPPPMVEEVVESITSYYPPVGAVPPMMPLPGAGFAPLAGAGGGFGGGGSGVAGAGGGFGLIAAAAAIPAIVAAVDDDDDRPGVIASPSVPVFSVPVFNIEVPEADNGNGASEIDESQL